MLMFALLLLAVLVVVFAIAFLWPEGSRKIQEKVKAGVSRLVRPVRSREGRVPDRAVDAVEKGGRATEESAHAGRRAHDEVFDSERGARQDEVLEHRHGDGAERGDEDEER